MSDRGLVMLFSGTALLNLVGIALYIHFIIKYASVHWVVWVLLFFGLWSVAGLVASLVSLRRLTYKPRREDKNRKKLLESDL